ncbi:MAG: hypothetical protein AAFV53_37920, partial [Myxococcota bacterium]
RRHLSSTSSVTHHARRRAHPSLERGDSLRETDGVQALEAYATCSTDALCSDMQRLTWIVENAVPNGHRSMLERLATHAPARGGRMALNMLGRSHWYAGETEQAEAYWSLAARSGRAARDTQWVTSILNVALVQAKRGRLFPPLMLYHQGREVARTLKDPYHVAFSTVRRGHLLIQLRCLDAAANEFHDATPLIEAVTHREHHLALLEAANTGRGHLLRDLGDLEGAYDTYERSRQIMMMQGGRFQAVTAGIEAHKYSVAFDLFPDKRIEILREVETLTARYNVRQVWRRGIHYKRLYLWLRYLDEEGGAPHDARALLKELIALDQDLSVHQQETLRIAQIGERLGEPELAGQLYEQHASRLLKQIVDAQDTAQQFPEMQHENLKDWALLDTVPREAALQHEQILPSLRRLWRPGNPAYESVVRNGLVLVCAWCTRVCTAGGGWLPIAKLIPQAANETISHGLCEDCAAREFGIH